MPITKYASASPALQLDPKMEDAYVNRAGAEIAGNVLPAAMQDLARALLMDPGDQKARALLDKLRSGK